MQETRNSCFVPEKRNMIFCVAKINKHECRKIISTHDNKYCDKILIISKICLPALLLDTSSHHVIKEIKILQNKLM